MSQNVKLNSSAVKMNNKKSPLKPKVQQNADGIRVRKVKLLGN
jgi:hypothetical protein